MAIYPLTEESKALIEEVKKKALPFLDNDPAKLEEWLQEIIKLAHRRTIYYNRKEIQPDAINFALAIEETCSKWDVELIKGEKYFK
ncbi:MAG: hypothetical protein ACE5J3_01090 [Methanosarcinales archaeon]